MSTHTPVHDAGWHATDDTSLGAALTSFLNTCTPRPALLGLGEPMHGDDAFPRLRNQMLQHLVHHEGYRSIALESDCLAGLRVETFVTTGQGSLDDVLRTGLSHGWFNASTANRELLAWLRDHNRNRNTADQVRFYGFDAPLENTSAASPRPALTALHTYLTTHLGHDHVPWRVEVIEQLAGDDTRWTDTAAVMDPSRSVGASDAANQLRLIATDLLAVLTTESPRLIAATSHDDWWRAQLYGRTAVGLLQYHAIAADDSDTRVSRLLGQRDAMMAANLQAIRDRETHRGPTLVFASNAHLQRTRSRWQGKDMAGEDMTLEWWSAGAIIAAQDRDQYTFIAADLGTGNHHGLPTAAPDTLQGILSAATAGTSIYSAPRLAVALRATETAPHPRTGQPPNPSYFPLDVTTLNGIDGVAFLADTTR
jgi:erythromycin esterase-like protein